VGVAVSDFEERLRDERLGSLTPEVHEKAIQAYIKENREKTVALEKLAIAEARIRELEAELRRVDWRAKHDTE
jgi:transcription elongation GreA/GreB family factor